VLHYTGLEGLASDKCSSLFCISKTVYRSHTMSHFSLIRGQPYTQNTSFSSQLEVQQHTVNKDHQLTVKFGQRLYDEDHADEGCEALLGEPVAKVGKLSVVVNAAPAK
jgi:hypothetical protein